MRDFLEENSAVLVSFRRKRTCFQAKVALLHEHYNKGSKVVKSVQNEAKSLLDEYDDDGHFIGDNPKYMDRHDFAKSESEEFKEDQ